MENDNTQSVMPSYEDELTAVKIGHQKSRQKWSIYPYMLAALKYYPNRHRNKTTLSHPHEGQSTPVKMGQPLIIIT